MENSVKSNKLSSISKLIVNEIVISLKTKWIGFFVGFIAWVMTIIYLITYGGIVEELFAGGVIVFSLLGIFGFVVLSLFRQTSSLSVIFLMVCNFMCLICFSSNSGLVDYFSTHFFDGFSVELIFELPFSVWFCIIMFVVSFVFASVAMYLPQNRKIKGSGENLADPCGCTNADSCGNSDENSGIRGNDNEKK